MKAEIPDFLLKMSNDIASQDNRMTADPMFMVCYDKEVLAPQEMGYEYSSVIDDHKECATVCKNGDLVELKNYLIENEMRGVIDKFCDDRFISSDEFTNEFDIEFDLDEIAGFREVFISKEMTVVNAHLTEEGANAFIARKQHDYPKLYTYVFSMCYCWDMIELRNWIVGLSESQVARG